MTRERERESEKINRKAFKNHNEVQMILTIIAGSGQRKKKQKKETNERKRKHVKKERIIARYEQTQTDK